ncbi:MAG: class I SAM-dependent methyltransferase, partial [Acidobacteriota bacterium]
MGLTCRFCRAPLDRTFVDLGVSPLANSYLEPEDLQRPETFYPLEVFLCEECLLVQLPEAARPEEIFTDYAYFSSVSESWVEHARHYAEAMIERFGLSGEGIEDRLVIEIASNDGYLLRHFRDRGVPVLGIEPARNVAVAAREAGIPTETEFFTLAKARELVDRGVRPDLLVGNNVLAHVPELEDFVAGLKTVLAPDGVVTMEFPHLLRLMDEHQFDTIYHEHFSYFSFHVVRRIFAHHGLTLFDVEELPTHGGSLRIFGRHAERDGEAASEPIADRVADLLAREEAAGLLDPATYDGFAER